MVGDEMGGAEAAVHIHALLVLVGVMLFKAKLAHSSFNFIIDLPFILLQLAPSPVHFSATPDQGLNQFLRGTHGR